MSATAVAVISGGAAWAATGATSPHVPVHAADVTSSTDVTDTSVPDGSTTTTDAGAADTSTTVVTDTTTTTEVSGDTTTTTAVSGETSTTVPCKPGWGYGDTNHCHSGPPGLVGHGNGHGPGHGHGHGKH